MRREVGKGEDNIQRDEHYEQISVITIESQPKQEVKKKKKMGPVSQTNKFNTGFTTLRWNPSKLIETATTYSNSSRYQI